MDQPTFPNALVLADLNLSSVEQSDVEYTAHVGIVN